MKRALASQGGDAEGKAEEVKASQVELPKLVVSEQDKEISPLIAGDWLTLAGPVMWDLSANSSDTIGRFHPLRKLSPEMASDVIPWTLEIQNKSQEAQAVYQLISRLVRSGVTHLAASTLRPSKLGRSPLATAVDKMPLMHSILWASSCSQDGLCVDHAGLFKFLQWLSVQHKPQPIWENIAFRAIAKQWSQPLRSQDPAAFLQFLQPMLFAGSTGLWQSRAYPEPHSCVCEIVQCRKAWPIKMPEVLSPDSPCSLQSVISRWSDQPQVHGLSTSSPFVALQLQIFRADGSKLEGSITGPWKVDLPHFTDSQTQPQWEPYVVHSIQIHEDTHLLQGHIRAVLLEAGSIRFITVDSKRAVRVKQNEIPQLGSKMYIFLLERCQQEHV